MPQLDSIRAIAVAAVLLCHLTPYFPAANSFGVWGVRLFYVLSGFLITGILLRCKRELDEGAGSVGSVAGRFYLRRALRIFPPYYLVVAASAICDFGAMRSTLPWHLTYTSNILRLDNTLHLGPFDHFWSLAIEEQFYLLWPWIVLLTPRRIGLRVVLATVALGPISRVVTFAFTDELRAMFPLTSCLDTLGAGALLAYLWDAGLEARSLKWLKIASIVAIGLLVPVYALRSMSVTTQAIHLALRDLLLAVLFGALIGHAAVGIKALPGKLFDWSLLRSLGKISYGVYLYHRFVEWSVAAIRATPKYGWGTFALNVALTIALAAVSWRFFERPLNGLKDRLPYLRERPAPLEVVNGAASMRAS
jgi:peptidoglycan/LPS O-acetylase OafA/YrhL